MPDAEIRERVKVCRRYDELKSDGNGEKRIAKLCSEFPFLSNASNVANLVKMWKARYKKFDLDIGNNKIQTSRRHKGRVVIMQRVPSSRTKKTTVWNELGDWLLSLVANLRRECNVVTVEVFHKQMHQDLECPSRTEGLAERDPKGMKALMESDKSTREWLINRVGARLGVPLKTGVTLAAASMLAAQLQLFNALPTSIRSNVQRGKTTRKR